jgi:hypothetical protein
MMKVLIILALLSGQGHGRKMSDAHLNEAFPLKHLEEVSKAHDEMLQRALAISKYDLLSGNYTNELGSVMQLEWTGEYLVGFYVSAVGHARGAYSIHGGASSCWEDEASVGFCVAWINEENGNSNSTTCWTGHLLVNGGDITLNMFWILSVKPGSDGALWSSTLMGQDIFTKV